MLRVGSCIPSPGGSCSAGWQGNDVFSRIDIRSIWTTNSMPVRSTMGLTFNELTPIFANDYNPDLTALDPSITDLGTNLTGNNSITDDDLGF